MKNGGRAEAAQLVSLGECAQVLPGFSIRGRIGHDSNGTHQLILTRHLTDGIPYEYEPTHELRIVPHTHTGPYELRTGDVLFMSRGTRNRAWVLGQIPKDTIAPVSFYIIRPQPGLDGRYLAWYLNQTSSQAAIDRMRTGAGTPLIQRRLFEALSVVVPAEAIQSEVAQVGELMARERLLRGRLDHALDRLQSLQSTTIIEGLRDAARRKAQ